MADRNIRSPLLRTPSASMARSRLGRRSHLLLAWFKPSRVPSPNHCGPAISTPRFQASKKAWGAAAKCRSFPWFWSKISRGSSWFLAGFLADGSGNGELGPAASFEGALRRGMAAEVLAGFPRNGTIGIARADVVAGGALQDFERQELAAVGRGQPPQRRAVRGLLEHGRAPWRSGALSLAGWRLPQAVEENASASWRRSSAQGMRSGLAGWAGGNRGSLEPWLLACADGSANMRAASGASPAASVGKRNPDKSRLVGERKGESPARWRGCQDGAAAEISRTCRPGHAASTSRMPARAEARRG